MRQLLLSLTLCFLAMPALADSPTAMITSLNGSALVINGDTKTVAEPMMSLTPRTLIELRQGATMSVVFFSRGSHVRFTGPALIGIGKNRSKVFEGNPSAATEVASDSALIKAIDPNALAEAPPSGGVSASTQDGKTTIFWQAKGQGPFLVNIYKPAQNGQPRASVWAEELMGTSVVYTGPVLDPNVTYVAEVKAGETRIAGTQFRVGGGHIQNLGAAKAEADAMASSDPSDTTPHVLMHTLYAQVGDNDSAVLALHPAMAAQPEEDAFVNRLNVMGQAINRKANQDTAYAQAYYQAEENWTYSPFWDADRWDWDGWDNF